MLYEIFTTDLESQATSLQVRSVFAGWQRAAVSGLPSLRALDTPALVRYRPHLLVLVRQNEQHFTHVFCGQALTQSMGIDLATRSTAEFSGQFADMVRQSYQRAVQEQRPLLLVHQSHGSPVWERLVLPVRGPDDLPMVLVVVAVREAATLADVTAWKQEIQELEKQRRELMYRAEVLEEQAGELSGTIAQVETARAALSEEIARRQQLEHELTRVATMDALTNLPNRHAFVPAAQQAFATARRYATALTAIAIDLDFFKKINDTYGHMSGDAVLRMVADIISSCLRTDVDIPCRFGGEEFIILLPHTAMDGALVVAERLRSLIETMQIASAEHVIRVSASFGVAELMDQDASYEGLVNRADMALYKAKGGGRNRVESAVDPHEVAA